MQAAQRAQSTHQSSKKQSQGYIKNTIMKEPEPGTTYACHAMLYYASEVLTKIPDPCSSPWFNVDADAEDVTERAGAETKGSRHYERLL